MGVTSGKLYTVYILLRILLIEMPSLTTVTNCDHVTMPIQYISSLRPKYHKVGNTPMQNNATHFWKQTEECAPGKPLPNTNHNGRKHKRVKTQSLQP